MNLKRIVTLTVLPLTLGLFGCAKQAPIWSSVNPVYFQSGTADVTGEDDYYSIDRAIKGLQQEDELYLLLAGYADSTGDAEANELLSYQRAEAIRTIILEGSGVDPDRVMVVALGEEANTDDMQEARRVEFIFHVEGKDAPTTENILTAVGIDTAFIADLGIGQ